MFIVVVYDIADDKRRTRLHKMLLRYGEPVQLSAFECILTPVQFDEMRKEVASVAGDERNNVRYYDLCEKCHRQTVTMGRAVTTSIKPVYII